MNTIKCLQVLIKNYLHLDINAKIDLESQKNKIKNELIDSIVCRKMVAYMIYDQLVDK